MVLINKCAEKLFLLTKNSGGVCNVYTNL